MESRFCLWRSDALPCRLHARVPFPLESLLIVLGFAMPAATADAALPRFQFTGSGILMLDEPMQNSGNLQLKGHLTPALAAATTQQAGQFALSALLSPSSLVCYNDTIFRDSFDGTGL